MYRFETVSLITLLTLSSLSFGQIKLKTGTQAPSIPCDFAQAKDAFKSLQKRNEITSGVSTMVSINELKADPSHKDFKAVVESSITEADQLSKSDRMRSRGISCQEIRADVLSQQKAELTELTNLYSVAFFPDHNSDNYRKLKIKMDLPPIKESSKNTEHTYHDLKQELENTLNLSNRFSFSDSLAMCRNQPIDIRIQTKAVASYEYSKNLRRKTLTEILARMDSLILTTQRSLLVSDQDQRTLEFLKPKLPLLRREIIAAGGDLKYYDYVSDQFSTTEKRVATRHSSCKPQDDRTIEVNIPLVVKNK